jgi:hypothetical protein
MISQYFEFAIDKKWVQFNPTIKVKVKIHDRKIYEGSNQYKAVTPEVRTIFWNHLTKMKTIL